MEWITLALSLADSVAKIIKEKDPEAVREYEDAKEKYLEEMSKNYDIRDDSIVDFYRDQLKLRVENLLKRLPK